MSAVGVEVHARERAGAEREVGDLRCRRTGSAGGRARASRRRRAGGGRGRPAEHAAGACSPGSGQSRCASALSISAVMRSRDPLDHLLARTRGRTARRRSRPGRCASGRCGASPPTGPAISVSRRSTAMWMSSSSSRNGNVPARSSPSTASSPASSASRSSSPMMPCAASMRACARDCATSYGQRRRSTSSERLMDAKSGSWGSAKRDMPRESRRARGPRAAPWPPARPGRPSSRGRTGARSSARRRPRRPGTRPRGTRTARGRGS